MAEKEGGLVIRRFADEDRLNKAFEMVKSHEGGFVNDPDDPGGATNVGITLKAYIEFCEDTGRDVPTVESLRKLTENDMMTFYGRRYFDPFMWIEDDRLFYLLCDTAVNNGRSRAILWLQRAVGLLEDGVMGPKTKTAVNDAVPNDVFFRVFALRMKEYGTLPTRNPKLVKFIGGWLNRLATFLPGV